MYKKTMYYLVLMLVSLFFLGCTESKNTNIPPQRTIVIPEPKVINLTLVAGKTTRDEVQMVLGAPESMSSYKEYNASRWRYIYEVPQNIILKIIATQSDGYTINIIKDIRKEWHMISLSFKGNILTDFSL